MGTLEPTAWHAQDGFSFRFDWAPSGVAALADCVVLMIVDVLRFTTAVTVAAERGITVTPAATGSSGSLAALSPATIRSHSGGHLELWSLNGAQVSLTAAATGATVIAASLRNASAAANAAAAVANGGPIGVIAAGERWPDGSLRPAEEDLIGAGAVLRALDPGGSLTEPCCSPAARAARAAFIDAEPLLLDLLTATASGRELWERGHGDDVREAARLDISTVVPTLDGGTFQHRSP
ncbi:MAG TPA: 2-phosphosulfolactate phosphatase [Ilumatobacter sp.]|nr:2-phosphosulfolactate phosphatase [Ilumatobacter sp.]